MLAEETKRCSACGETKVLGEFYRNRREKDGLGRHCKLCARAYNDAYAKTDAGKASVRKYRRKYYQDNRAVVRDAQRRYGNKPDVLARRPLYAASFRERRPYWTRMHHANARAEQYGVGGRVTETDIRSLYEDQRGLCYYCGRELDESYVGEHKTPLSRGGDNDLQNICLSCASCNVSKSDRTEMEYYRYLALVAEAERTSSDKKYVDGAVMARIYRRFWDFVFELAPSSARRRYGPNLYCPFGEARAYIRRKGLYDSVEYRLWARTKHCPPDIPVDPEEAYPAEWQGWASWLGESAGGRPLRTKNVDPQVG